MEELNTENTKKGLADFAKTKAGIATLSATGLIIILLVIWAVRKCRSKKASGEATVENTTKNPWWAFWK